MNFCCKYCKKPCNQNLDFPACWFCNLHPKLNVIFWLEDYYEFNSNSYIIESDKFVLNILENKNYMRLFKKHPNYKHITDIPIDPNLTPENFNQKLKTYLNFI